MFSIRQGIGFLLLGSLIFYIARSGGGNLLSDFTLYVPFAVGLLAMFLITQWPEQKNTDGGEITSAVKNYSAKQFYLAAHVSISLGVILGLTSFAIVWQNSSSPEAIGPSIAIALVPLVFGYTLSELFFYPLYLSRVDIETEVKGPRRALLLLGTALGIIMFLAFTIFLFMIERLR